MLDKGASEQALGRDAAPAQDVNKRQGRIFSCGRAAA